MRKEAMIMMMKMMMLRWFAQEREAYWLENGLCEWQKNKTDEGQGLSFFIGWDGYGATLDLETAPFGVVKEFDCGWRVSIARNGPPYDIIMEWIRVIVWDFNESDLN